MRWQLAACALAASTSTFAARQAQQPLQIYLHPTPTDSQSIDAIPTLTADQAKAVLSHHLGEEIGDFEEIPADEGLWGHLMNMWGGRPTLHSTVWTEDRPKAKVIFIEGGVMPQDVLPTSLPQQPSFYLNEGKSTKALLAPYLRRAADVLDHILDNIPEWTKNFLDTFEVAGTRAAAALGHELSCLTAMADSIPWIDDAKHAFSWDAISITGLSHVSRQNKVWEEGRKGVQAGLAAMTTPDSAPLLLIIRPSTSTHLYSRALPPLKKLEERQGINSSQSCYSSNQTCSSSTTCSGRGVCTLKLSTSDGECWGCKCANGYAGAECQKADYSVPFIMLVFSTILLLALAIGSVALLYTVGETKLPSTLNLAIGGSMKRD